MKTQLLMLTAAGLLAFSQPSYAANRDVDAYLQTVGSAVEARLEAAGVQTGQPIQITAEIAGDGRVQNARLAQSTGSVETDAKVNAALRKLSAPQPPTVLAGRKLRFTIGEPALKQAKLP